MVINMNHTLLANRNVLAWFLLVSAAAVHVLDETLSDFLPFWNQLVTNLRAEFGFLPLPTFSFEAWLGGLIIAILFGYALIPAVNSGRKFIRVLTTCLGILMLLNALGHLLGSLYFGKILAGMWSSPFLLLAAIFVIIRGFTGDWNAEN
jgi:hypothetical protein